MKILFVTHYFPPEVNAPANRTIEHCRRWVQDGHDVTVNTAQSSVTATLMVDTKIRRFAEGTLSDLQPGMRVTLVGEPGPDGAVEARSVLLNPEDRF